MAEMAGYGWPMAHIQAVFLSLSLMQKREIEDIARYLGNSGMRAVEKTILYIGIAFKGGYIYENN